MVFATSIWKLESSFRRGSNGAQYSLNLAIIARSHFPNSYRGRRSARGGQIHRSIKDM